MPGGLRLAMASLLVRDYDEAIAYFRDVLGFDLLEDRPLGDGKRWVVVGQAGEASGRLLLARAATPAQLAQVGCQAGGRVGFFLVVDDFAAEHRRMVAAGVRFLEEPRNETYGRVAKLADLYGNLWDLLEGLSRDAQGTG